MVSNRKRTYRSGASTFGINMSFPFSRESKKYLIICQKPLGFCAYAGMTEIKKHICQKWMLPIDLCQNPVNIEISPAKFREVIQSLIRRCLIEKLSTIEGAKIQVNPVLKALYL
jgi:hypothetical protein